MSYRASKHSPLPTFWLGTMPDSKDVSTYSTPYGNRTGSATRKYGTIGGYGSSGLSSSSRPNSRPLPTGSDPAAHTGRKLNSNTSSDIRKNSTSSHSKFDYTPAVGTLHRKMSPINSALKRTTKDEGNRSLRSTSDSNTERLSENLSNIKLNSVESVKASSRTNDSDDSIYGSREPRKYRQEQILNDTNGSISNDDTLTPRNRDNTGPATSIQSDNNETKRTESINDIGPTKSLSRQSSSSSISSYGYTNDLEVSGLRSELPDGTGQSSVEEGKIFCQPCSSDDEFVVAMGYCHNCNEYFCSACLKLHRKQTMSRNHFILDGSNMPNILGPKVDLESCSELCVKHTNEIVKFYCSSHDTVGCGDCIILEHRACKVERIQDISTKYFNGPEHTQLAETVANFLEELVELRHCIQTAEKDINRTKAVADIRAFRKEVNDYLDRAESEIQSKVDRRKENIEKTISHLAEDQQSLHTETHDFKEKLKLQSSKANELFVAAKQMKGRMASLDRHIKQMVEKSQIQHYKFEPSSDLKQILSFKVPLGRLEIITRKGHSEKKIEDI